MSASRLKREASFVSDRLRDDHIPSGYRNSILAMRFATKRSWSDFLKDLSVTGSVSWQIAAPHVHAQVLSASSKVAANSSHHVQLCTVIFADMHAGGQMCTHMLLLAHTPK